MVDEAMSDPVARLCKTIEEFKPISRRAEAARKALFLAEQIPVLRRELEDSEREFRDLLRLIYEDSSIW